MSTRTQSASERTMTPERAEFLYHKARGLAVKTGGPWVDQLRACMTDEEITYVKSVWQKMSFSASFIDAFFKILNEKEIKDGRDTVTD